jgi:hypothetical protein
MTRTRPTCTYCQSVVSEVQGPGGVSAPEAGSISPMAPPVTTLSDQGGGPVRNGDWVILSW